MAYFRFCGLLCALLCGYTAQAQPVQLQIPFSQSPVPAAPDYAQAPYWAALPTRKDAADIAPKKYKDLQATAKADVFFIHPTTYTGQPTDSFQWNANLANAELNKKVDERPIKFQASVFNGSCRVYAPRYRQAHYYCFITPSKTDRQAALDIAYADVRAAFAYYLKNYNQGRPIVIAGHSQGTIHAQRLLREFFENQPLQKQLVCAYLIGMPVPTDSLPTLSPCADSASTGCYISWRTFERGHNTSWQAGDPARLVCHNPLSWQRDTFYTSKLQHQGAVLRSFKRPLPQICDAQVHEGILWVTKPRFPGSRLIKNPNYHVGDYNLFYLDIRKNVGVRVEAFVKNNP